MGTTVLYNGVRLANVVTRDFQQTVVYDPSNTDEMFTTFRMTFDGVIHGGDRTILGMYPTQLAAGSSSPTVLIEVSRRLHEPRKRLTVWVGPQNVESTSTVILDCLPYAEYSQSELQVLDVSNGPRPIDVRITHIASDKVFRVSFTIECSITKCSNGTTPPQNGHVLSNRWRIEEEMDSNFFTTRTISGSLRLSYAGIWGHYYKTLVIPPLEMGFRREALRYVVSENSLECNYTIRDRQVHTAAPWPATDISGTYTESTNDGVTFRAEMSIRLTGSPEADKASLIQRAVQIVDSRLNITETRGATTPDYWIEHAAITEHIGAENVVEMSVRIQRSPGIEADDDPSGLSLGEAMTKVISQNFGKTIELPDIDGNAYDPRVSRLPNLYGYNPQTGLRSAGAALMLLHCALQTPCSPVNDHKISQREATVQPLDELPETTEVTGSVQSPGDVANDDAETQYSADHREALYTYYELQNTYSKQMIRVQAPYASLADANSDTCKVFTLASGQAIREIKLEAERQGAWPQIPEPLDFYEDGMIRGHLIKHVEFSQPPKLSPDGRYKFYKIEAVYRWALNRFPKADEATHTGVLAFTKYTQSDNALTRSGIYSGRLTP